MLLSKVGPPLWGSHQAREELLTASSNLGTNWGMSPVQIGGGSCNLTRSGEKEPTPLKADRKELRLHGTPSVRICSLPGWVVQTRPYAPQFLSIPLNDLVTLSFYFVDSHDTWTCQRMCKSLLCWKQTSWSCLQGAAGPWTRDLSDTQADVGLQRKTGMHDENIYIMEISKCYKSEFDLLFCYLSKLKKVIEKNVKNAD